tara:strand:+ start:2896 stop:3141 length:246 start_codon:yes stop_codon:yes gene_type:complete
MVELLAQFGAASTFAGILATLLWRVIVQGREERAELMKVMQEDNRRNVEALNGLKEVMTELRITMQHAMLQGQNRNNDGLS